MAQVLDGLWENKGAGAELVDGPHRSKQLYQAFRDLYAQARDGRLTPQQVQARAAELDEGIGKAVGALVIRYPKTAIFLLAFLAMMKFANLETKVDVNRLVDQVIEYLDTHQPEEIQRELQPSKVQGQGETDGRKSTPKQDRLPHPPSVTRKLKAAKGRKELRERRRQFNPKK